MADVVLKWNHEGFQEVLARSKGVVDEQGALVALKAGEGVRAKPVTLTRFEHGPRPGCVVATRCRTQKEADDAKRRLERSL